MNAVRLTQTLAFSFVRHVRMGHGTAGLSLHMVVCLREEVSWPRTDTAFHFAND